MTPEAVVLQFGGGNSKKINLGTRTSGVGTRGRAIRGKSSLSSCSPSNLRGGGPEQPEAGLHELVRNPGAHRTDPSGEPRINCGVTIEDVGPEDEPVLVGSRTDPSNIKYPSLIIDDDIYENKNSAFDNDVVNSVDNENFLAEKIKVDKVESLNFVKPKVDKIESLKFVKGLPSVSIDKLSYCCKIVGDKHNKKKYYFKINSFCNSV